MSRHSRAQSSLCGDPGRRRQSLPYFPGAFERLESRNLLAGYTLSKIAAFDGVHGAFPIAGLALDGDGNLLGIASATDPVHKPDSSFDVPSLFKVAAGSHTITSVKLSSALDGFSPLAYSDGVITGTTDRGGNGRGTVFQIDPATMTFTAVFGQFSLDLGILLRNGAISPSQDVLYGTAYGGGSHHDGVIYRYIVPTKSYHTLYSFRDAEDGAFPEGGLVYGGDGFYGTTAAGGANGIGTIFKYDPVAGTLTARASFDATGGGATGATELILDGNGNIFGAGSGGPEGRGTIFEVFASSNSITTLATFDSNLGQDPLGKLVMDSHGNLYGLTSFGGTGDAGTVFKYDVSTGILTTIYSATAATTPAPGLVMDADDNLYFASRGDQNDRNWGAIYELSPADAPLQPTQLAFVQQPATLEAGSTISPGVTVAIKDQEGHVRTESTATVTLSIFSGPAGGKFKGTVSAAAVNGIATFSNLTLSTPGEYQLKATSGALIWVNSAKFKVLSPPKIQLFRQGEIKAGDLAPSPADGTDLGSVGATGSTLDAVFYISNGGDLPLSVNGAPKVSISGANAADFQVLLPPGGAVDPQENSPFTIRFTPSAPGVRMAQLTIASDDPSRPAFSFAIQAEYLPSTDLTGVFSSKGVIPGSVGDGDRLTIPITLQNSGWVPAQGYVSVLVQASPDGSWHDGINPFAIWFGKVNLGRDAMATVNAVGFVPPPVTLPLGDYQLVARIIPSLNITEPDTSNNYVTLKGGAAAPLHVIAAVPDLTVRFGTLSPTFSAYVPNDVIKVPVVVTNGGIRTALAGKLAPITVEIRQSNGDNVFDASDPLLGQFNITASIGAGKSAKQTVSIKLPDGIQTGSFYMVAKVETGVLLGELNQTNNTTTTAAPLSVVREFGNIPGRAGSTPLTFTEPDGTLVTLSLAAAGLGTLVLGPDGYDIAVSGTAAASKLQIRTVKSATPGDDGRFLLHDLVIGNPGDADDHTPIGTITASTTDVTGDILITGPAAALTLGNLADQHLLSIGAAAVAPAAKPAVTLTFGTIANTTLTSLIGIRSLTAIRWLDPDSQINPDVIAAPFIGTLNIKGSTGIAGDFQASLLLNDTSGASLTAATLQTARIAGQASIGNWAIQGDVGAVNINGGGSSSLHIAAVSIQTLTLKGQLVDSQLLISQGVNPKKQALGTLTAGAIVTSQIQAAGNIGAVKAGMLDHSTLFAGVESSLHTLPAAPGDFAGSSPADFASIKALTLTGVPGNATVAVFTNSLVAAPGIASVALPVRSSAILDADALGPFGFATLSLPVKSYVGPLSAGNFVNGADAAVL
ncbi:MAG TPA: choice-of-anchor tandem repeat GloVer-containing protein [Phycisphaerae bacterium]|nr:choice-of-anchor tandem repeat GloVer-containing protein [Phycisphaerae bacterium]